MKRSTQSLIAVAVLTTLAFTSTAFAAPRGAGSRAAAPQESGDQMPGYGPYGNMTPEQMQTMITIKNESNEKLSPVFEQIWVKQTTLDALANNSKTDPAQVTALITEISALRQQVITEQQAMRARMTKELGTDLPYASFGGMGRGMGGGKHGGMHGGRQGGMHGGRQGGMGYGMHGGRCY